MTDDNVDIRAVLRDEARIERFDQLREHLKDSTNHEKISKTATVRMAIDMAHDAYREQQEQLKDAVGDYKRAERELKNYAREL